MRSNSHPHVGQIGVIRPPPHPTLQATGARPSTSQRLAMTTPPPQPPPIVNYSDEYTFPQSSSTDRLAAMRPESLRALNTNTPSPHNAAHRNANFFHHNAEYDANDMNEALHRLRGLVGALQTTEVPVAAVIDGLHSVIESLCAARDNRSVYPRDNRHTRLYHSVNYALRRSASDFENDTVSDRNLADVVEWISNEYLTPTRRHSTSSEPTGPISSVAAHLSHTTREGESDGQSSLSNTSIADYVVQLNEAALRRAHHQLLDDKADVTTHNGLTVPDAGKPVQRDGDVPTDEDDHSHLHPFTSPQSRFSRTRPLIAQ